MPDFIRIFRDAEGTFGWQVRADGSTVIEAAGTGCQRVADATRAALRVRPDLHDDITYTEEDSDR